MEPDKTTDHGEADTASTQPALVQEFLGRAMSSDDAQVERSSQLLLQDAIRERATDIHIDPFNNGARIRLRIDGKMRDAAHVPTDVSQQLINQMKVLARLDPIFSPTPLESRWHETSDDHSVDIRLTVIACHGGEKLHARLLDSDRQELSLDGLGIPAQGRAVIENWQKERVGMLLVTGPTGAGKTTTLHTILEQFVDSQLNVITIEDPVEYELNGATQIQVDEQAGLSFAAGIRTILRLDPDCMLVGELRDPESATTAMKAAATGHTVLSSLHARDAIGTISTLRHWGVKNGPIATMLNTVVNQRLVGRLCPACKFDREPNTIEQEWFETNGLPLAVRVGDATGCETCKGVGIYGRTGIYEFWQLTDEDRERIARGDDARALAESLRNRHHSFLVDAFYAKVRASEVAVSEVD